MTNLQAIEERRYEEIKGLPYLFDDWVIGDIVRQDGVVLRDLPLRYNAHTGDFEVRKDEKFIVLDQLSCLQVWIDPQKNMEVESMTGHRRPIHFRRDFHADYPGKFAKIIFESDLIMLVSDYAKRVEKKKFESPGKTMEVQRFVTKRDYFLIYQSTLSRINLKASAMIDHLGHQPEVTAFMKRQKIKKIKDEEDAYRILDFYNRLLK